MTRRRSACDISKSRTTSSITRATAASCPTRTRRSGFVAERARSTTTFSPIWPATTGATSRKSASTSAAPRTFVLRAAVARFRIPSRDSSDRTTTAHPTSPIPSISGAIPAQWASAPIGRGAIPAGSAGARSSSGDAMASTTAPQSRDTPPTRIRIRWQAVDRAVRRPRQRTCVCPVTNRCEAMRG